jgi:hypothetical protein
MRGDVAVVLARLVGGAENDLVDPVRVQAGASDGLPDDQSGQVVGAHAGERAAVPTDRGADSAYQERLSHGENVTTEPLRQG